jgi:cell wall-associated NlpC family hydrolase
MKTFLSGLLCLGFVALVFAMARVRANGTAQPDGPDFQVSLKSSIENHLGRPYVWGSSGLKSFDCSGFVWRVMQDSGILIKRTTARKLYMCLPSVPEEKKWDFGNVVFFDDLKHCGIVESPSRFYHSESSIGTNLSSFDPYWRRKIYAVRAIKSSGF